MKINEEIFGEDLAGFLLRSIAGNFLSDLNRLKPVRSLPVT
jgi:hypothetical protein